MLNNKVLKNYISSVLLLLCLFLASCKTGKNSVQQDNAKKLSIKNTFTLDAVGYKNKEDELNSIDNKLNSLKKNDNTLIIIDGKKTTIKDLYKVDSSYTIDIIKNNSNKYGVSKKYKTLIIANKKSS